MGFLRNIGSHFFKGQVRLWDYVQAKPIIDFSINYADIQVLEKTEDNITCRVINKKYDGVPYIYTNIFEKYILYEPYDEKKIIIMLSHILILIFLKKI